ncbi:hypothetical protein ADIAL_0421 [Alkalibacterium sp. AK22]|nr:hypothetical protein ADIAL_0421 [Alkalibacterium sp. AK22]
MVLLFYSGLLKNEPAHSFILSFLIKKPSFLRKKVTLLNGFMTRV